MHKCTSNGQAQIASHVKIFGYSCAALALLLQMQRGAHISVFFNVDTIMISGQSALIRIDLDARFRVARPIVVGNKVGNHY